MDYLALKELAIEVRKDIIQMLNKCKSGHPGGSLSLVEIMIALYYEKMNIDPLNPTDENRDRLVLSKGHGAPCLYSVLAHKGYFPREELLSLRQFKSRLQGHPDMKKLPGIDASTGSLGQGASISVGMALGAKCKGKNYQVYAILGDGELQEGIIWEASMAAAHYNLNNLTFIIDHNGLQIDGTNDEVMSLGNIDDKFNSFGFQVHHVDGHDFGQIINALNSESDKPKCIIAKTIKGKGISFMEDNFGWHGKAPSDEDSALALKELEGATL